MVKNDKSWEELIAYKYLNNANSMKYGHVIKHLKERKNIRIDEFPRTLTLSTQQFRKIRITSIQE